MKLSKSSYEWALSHLIKENDTDLFPDPIEIEIVNYERNRIIEKLENIDVGSYTWKPFRRFMIPKGELSYRIITQLHPLDSIMLSAMIYEYGHLIEQRRTAVSENKVFSYRFFPQSDGTLYAKNDSWKAFWTANISKAQNYDYIACLDISDFYNQIYHHTIENMLIDVGFPNEIKKSIMKLLENITQKMSRGVPVGPHAAHILAELSLLPIDDSLSIRGIEYCRYADDIIIFATSEVDARTKTYTIASLLDQNQRLILQRQKTRIYTKEEFCQYAQQMLADNPMDIQEAEMLEVINRHSDSNPYVKVSHADLNEDEIKVFSKEKVEALIDQYMSPDFPDYPRLRWLFRRFAQIGTPSAIEYCIRNMDKLIPAISDVCQYLISAADSYDGDWENIGEVAINLMQSELFKSNEFFQITLLNLFVKNTKMDHIAKLITLYPTASENIRRKVILCAYQNKAVSFIRELKEQYPSMQEWTKRAYLIACSILIPEERKFFLNNAASSFDQSACLESTIKEWAIKQ